LQQLLLLLPFWEAVVVKLVLPLSLSDTARYWELIRPAKISTTKATKGMNIRHPLERSGNLL
jgi:hypothetical protein